MGGFLDFPNTCLPIYTSHVHKEHSRHTPALTDKLASALVLDTSQPNLLFCDLGQIIFSFLSPSFLIWRMEILTCLLYSVNTK